MIADPCCCVSLAKFPNVDQRAGRVVNSKGPLKTTTFWQDHPVLSVSAKKKKSAFRNKKKKPFEKKNVRRMHQAEAWIT